MNTLALVMLLIFGGAFILKLLWLGWEFWRGRLSLDDDEDGPVSGWGTPRD